MRVFYDRGITVQDGIKEVVLDPERPAHSSIVSHAHMDHLTSGGIMTPATLDVMTVRKRKSSGIALDLNKERRVNGFAVTLRNAGHVFGSAMMRVDDLLYTGDVNPEGGDTCGKAEPEDCRYLVIEATYGRPELVFPPKQSVEQDLLSWVETELAKGPVILSGYEFGKAQELVALANRLKTEVAVTDKVAEIADVYRAYGHRLNYRRISELGEDERKDARVYVMPRSWIKPPMKEEIRWLREAGARAAYVSGWCVLYNFVRGYGIDAQFPLSDHGDFDDLIEFTRECNPKYVYTIYSNPEHLASEIARRLGIPATPLKVK